MKLYLTGSPCTQQRHCYFVQGEQVSFIVDCGFQRCYGEDALPHLTAEQIRTADYLFLSHSHENQSGALSFLYSKGFAGRVVVTTETARQVPFPIDDPLILEGLCLPYTEVMLPGGIGLTWGRSGHCSGSAWLRMREGGHSILFSGDYYDGARVHESDPIINQSADLAILDCEYGSGEATLNRNAQVDALITAIREALDDGRPVLLPVPMHGRGQGILTYISERLPQTDVFGDDHFRRELQHLNASVLWVRPEAKEMLADIYVRPIPQDFIALGVYFVSDPQLDTPAARLLTRRLMQCGVRTFLTGTIEPNTYASLLHRSGQARFLRYSVHCTQPDMLRIAAQNRFAQIIAYHSDYAPVQAVYEI